MKRSDSIKVYAYCLYNCKRFICTMNDISKCTVRKVNVYSTSINFKHIGLIKRQLRGVERSIIKNKLLQIKVLEQQQNDVLNLNNIDIKNSNIERLKSANVYQKARSEILAKNDRHKDDMFDMLLMHRQHGRYLQSVEAPLHVLIYV